MPDTPPERVIGQCSHCGNVPVPIDPMEQPPKVAIFGVEYVRADILASQIAPPAARVADCGCGHSGLDHREEAETGAARECLLCGCGAFYNVHMALAATIVELNVLRANHAAEKEKVWDAAIKIAGTTLLNADDPLTHNRSKIVAALKAARTADSREAKMEHEGITEEDIAETLYPTRADLRYERER